MCKVDLEFSEIEENCIDLICDLLEVQRADFVTHCLEEYTSVFRKTNENGRKYGIANLTPTSNRGQVSAYKHTCTE